MTTHASLRVLVTGATSGLGREMAVQLGRAGCRVALTGRRENLLQAAAQSVRSAGGEPLPLQGGVTDPAEVRAHYAEIRRLWGGLDWAILNAGIGDSEDGREFSAETLRRTFEVNVFGVAHWIEAVLPDMLAAGGGTLAAVSSLAAFRGLPASGAYSASKAAVVALLESLRVDLRGTGVSVVTVCPGFVKSELTERNDSKQMPFLLETEDGARRILAGIAAGRRLVHFPWQLSVPMVYLVRSLPGFLYDRVVGRFARRRKKKYVDASAGKP